MSRLRPPLLIGAILFLLSLTILYPILPHFMSRLPFGWNGDIKLSLAILDANFKHLSRLQFNQIYHLPIVYPLSYVMTSGSNLFGQSLLFLPLHLFGVRNYYLIYNLAVFIAILGAGLCAYLLFMELLGRRPVALVAAALYMLLPFRVHNIPHLNALFSFPIPLCLLFLLRYFKRERRRDLMLFFLFLVLQFLFDLALGFYLAVAGAIIYLIAILVYKRITLKSILIPLALAFLAALLVLAVFSPYLQKELTLSSATPVKSIRHHSSLSFYTGLSYLHLLLKRSTGGLLISPYFLGFIASALLLLAFLPHITRMREGILLGGAGLFLLGPGVLVFLVSADRPLIRLTAVGNVAITGFLICLLLLLLVLGGKPSPELRIFSYSFLAMILISFEPFSRWFGFFDHLANVLPFIRRTRGIYTQYTFTLLALAMFGFGLRWLWDKTGGKRKTMALLLVLLFAERLRWPVVVTPIREDRPEYQRFYGQLQRFPDHLGLLELPLLNEYANVYTLFTRYHHLHTCHGGLGLTADALGLSSRDGLSLKTSLQGLADSRLCDELKRQGIGVILVFKNIVRNETSSSNVAWNRVVDHVRQGSARGLFRQVVESDAGLMLVLEGQAAANELEQAIPYYALIGKKMLRLRVQTEAGAVCTAYLNGRPLGQRKTAPVPGPETLEFAIDRRFIKRWTNWLILTAGQPLRLREIELR